MPVAVHAGAAVDQQTDGDRRVGVAEELDALRLAVFDHCERVLGQVVNVGALAIPHRHVQDDQL